MDCKDCNKLLEYIKESGLLHKHDPTKAPVDIIIKELKKEISLRESVRRSSMTIINAWMRGDIKVNGNMASVLASLRRRLTF